MATPHWIHPMSTKNQFYVCVGKKTGKNHPSLSPSVGGQKSKEFNHSWPRFFWHGEECPLTTSMAVLVIQPTFRSGEKEPNASQHRNGAVCCSQRTKHKTQGERKNIISLLLDQPEKRKINSCLCEQNVRYRCSS